LDKDHRQHRIYNISRLITYNIRQSMLKLPTHSGFHDLFLNYLTSIISSPAAVALLYHVMQFWLCSFDILITEILASMIYFDSDMSKSTNTVVYFDWKTVIYIYACGKCRTQFIIYRYYLFKNENSHSVWYFFLHMVF
jgi:hypothetical protein